MKRTNHGTQLKGPPKQDIQPPPTPQTGKNPRDVRENDAKLAENQNDLGVREDHKTEDMEGGHRGTFP